jgi:hypothetical protein
MAGASIPRGTKISDNVVRDDDGEVIELPPPVQSRAIELERLAAEREARHAQQILKRAQYVLRRLGKWVVRELQDPDVQREFLRLLPQVDATDHRRGFS